MVLSLDLKQQDPSIRDRLWQRAAQFEQLTGINVASPIVPIIVGPEAAALEAR
jgi:7-keto-8-aminopelargonate synthetase-like enzyme